MFQDQIRSFIGKNVKAQETVTKKIIFLLNREFRQDSITNSYICFSQLVRKAWITLNFQFCKVLDVDVVWPKEVHAPNLPEAV